MTERCQEVVPVNCVVSECIWLSLCTFFQDVKLKLLRSTLLSSIRMTPKAISQHVCDTDVPDIDALREAALKSLNNQSHSSIENRGCDVSQSSKSLSSNTVRMKECFKDWVPKYRLRPQHRSNLVVTQAVSLDADHSEISSTSRNQDHWSKSDQRNAAKDQCCIQNVESEDEILTVDSIHSDLDEDIDDKTASTESISDKKSSTRVCMDKFESMLREGRHATLQLLTADVESYPAPVVVNDIVHTNNTNNDVQMEYIERELMYLQPGFDIELLGFDDSHNDQIAINDDNNCGAETNPESKSTIESSTIPNSLTVNNMRRRIVINEHRQKSRIRIRRSRSPSRNVMKKRRSKTPPHTSIYSRHGSSRRFSVDNPLSKLPTYAYSNSSNAVKHNDTNKPTYKSSFFALNHKYNRRMHFDNFV